MMKSYESWAANHKRDKEPSKKILKLGKKITDVAKHKIFGVKAEDPEYWGLAEIISDEMADVALKMKVRRHYTFDEMCEMCLIDKDGKEAFQKLLEEMSYVGLLEYDYGNHYDHNGRTAPQSERRYILPMFVPGSAELFNMEELRDRSNPRLENHPDVASFFERMTYIPLAGVTQMVPPGGAGIGMHVIPVEKAIEMENEAVCLEKLSYWLDKYEGHIGVGRCSCRASRKVLGDGCADDDFAWCIGVGDFADYCRETNKGHDITKEEALEILKRGEENGFVHQITNIDGENKIFGICNCNPQICNALRTSQLFNTPNLSRSAYVSKVDKLKCVACGRCVEVCPAGALKLGQKLCKKDGSIVEYPKQMLPDNHKWGKDKWDFNYRDNNRINTHKTGTSPCKAACPAHIAVQGYLKKAADGKYRDALALIKKQNPFPAVCGHVCNRPCEDECTRGSIDESVSIDAVKRFIAKKDLEAEHRYVPKKVVPASTYLDHFDVKIAIIGAGPAGLTAAYYLASMGYFPTVFEKHDEPGGMLRYGIPSYKLQKDVIKAEIDIMRELGVDIKTGVEVGKDITLDELRKQGYKCFYIAIGCSAGSRPGILNDGAEGTFTANDYLAYANCGDARFKGDVVVIGGGNVAIDASRVSARSGAKSVTQFSLERRDEMPASEEEVFEAVKDGVKIENGWGPKEVLVKKGKVTGIVMKKCLYVINGEGLFDPKYDENDIKEIKADRVIFAIGQIIDWGDLLKGSKVEFGRGNCPVADQVTFQTAEPDIFVGGDVYTGPKFVIDAIAQGKIAAESLHRYANDANLTIGRNRWEFNMIDVDNINFESYDNAPPQKEKYDSDLPKNTFKHEKRALTEEQVKTETARCLKCGACIVDENKCIGCGVCTTRCDFDAITIHRERPECTEMVPAEDKFRKILPYQINRIGRIIMRKKD
ncbi:MAG: FAD-dependent oxidoreductase [Eggerthellaceae bacterium]|nr:FAD-dependent oxidoreductase [Eggerthellaceae bacterium]